MKVVTHGALSVISAFATGIGSSVGIGLTMEVSFGNDYSANPRMIRKTLSALNRMFGKEFFPGIQVVSEIPRSAGFKTSSALTGAIVCGYLSHFGLEEEDTPYITAKCSRENRTSLTGALDDAWASLNGGLVLTNNTQDKIIEKRNVEEKSVLIAWPANIRRNTVKSADPAVKKFAPSVSRLPPIVESGDFRDSMVLNGLIYGMHFGLDQKVLRYFYSHGATHCSNTGKGPGIFAFFDDQRLEKTAVAEFEFPNYKIRSTKLSNEQYIVED